MKITVREFRSNISQYIQRMAKGETFEIKSVEIGKIQKTEYVKPKIDNSKLGNINPEQCNDKMKEILGLQDHTGIIDDQPVQKRRVEMTDEEIETEKLWGRMECDANEYIHEDTGNLEKVACDFCGQTLTENKIEPGGKFCCQRCVNPKLFLTYKKFEPVLPKFVGQGENLNKVGETSEKAQDVKKSVLKKGKKINL